ncbi:MAG: SufD family Fe-S cluster assembly protein [Candidatus Gracilibacteria bacterium]|jgi:Fe-S cluster assembly scaffold protein SufB
MKKYTKEFGTNLPRIISLKKNENKIVIFNKISESTVNLAENSDLILAGIITKGDKNHQKITFNLNGQNAKLQFLAIIAGKKTENFDFETESNHLDTDTKSDITVLSAMFDESAIIYKGNIIIEKLAKKTNSYLTHKILLLSPTAKAVTIPSLEIKEDDVTAGHSAVVGKPDEEILYYLASRGIDKKTAISLVVRGFLEDGTKSIADKNIQNILIEAVENSLSTI